MDNYSAGVIDHMYYYNKLTYFQCSIYLDDCEVLKVSGGLFALLILPSVILGTVGNVLLLIALCCHDCNILIRQKIMLLCYALNDICFMIGPCLCNYFGAKGLPWLGHVGYYINNTTQGCKSTAFLQTLISAVMSDLLLADGLMRATSYRILNVVIDIKGAVLAASLSLSLGLLHALPTILLTNVWYTQDGRKLCASDPRWSKFILSWVEIHNILFCDGAIQMLFIGICNCIIVRGLFGIKTNELMIKNAIRNTSSSECKSTLKDINQMIRLVLRKDDLIYLSFSTMMIIVCMITALAHCLVFQELYFCMKDNRNMKQGIEKLYQHLSTADLSKCFNLLVRVVYIWLVMLRISDLRCFLVHIFSTITCGKYWASKKLLSVADLGEKDIDNKLVALRLKEINDLKEPEAEKRKL